jgi:hypothetical protein
MVQPAAVETYKLRRDEVRRRGRAWGVTYEKFFCGSSGADLSGSIVTRVVHGVLVVRLVKELITPL